MSNDEKRTMSEALKLKIVEGSKAVSDRTLDGPDGFAPRLLVAVNLPYREPKDVTTWRRQNGTLSLTIRSGFNERTGQPIGLPYGKYPRLFMYYITTEAVRTRSRDINLGRSLADFMRRIGVGVGGYQSSGINKQVNRLVNSSIQWQRILPDGRIEGSEGGDLTPIKSHRLWWSGHSPDQDTLFPNYVRLDHDFYEEIVSKPVPWRLEAVQAVQSSPLGLDLLMWISWRTFGRKEAVEMSWHQLHKQMGSQTSVDEFRRTCLEQMARIKKVWPEMGYASPSGRLLVYPMRPMVAVKKLDRE